MLAQMVFHNLSATLYFVRIALLTIVVLNAEAALQPPPLNYGIGGSTVQVVLASSCPSPAVLPNSSSAVPSLLQSSSSAAPSPSNSADSPEAFLNIHNKYRKDVGVKPLTWDTVLANYADNYANERIGDCNAYYSNEGIYGRNMANSTGDLLGSVAVMMWADEKGDYDLRSNTCAEGRSCGNYTQVIWGSSIHLGCAKVRCDNDGSVVVCYYDPPGNLDGQGPLDVNQSTPAAPPPKSSVADRPTIGSVATPPSFVVAALPLKRPMRNPLQGRKKRAGVIVGLIVGICALFLGLGFILFFLRRKGRGSAVNELAFNLSFADEFRDGMGPREFTYNELSKATKNFAEEEKLGEGGFGSVYKGFLRNTNTNVAVKRVSRRSRQGIKEYTSEVKIISRLRHKNLVKLVGWCHEKELLLVYEFMPNGSLDSHLFKGRSFLQWNIRFKIVQGLGSALMYLHELGDFCVLHRDIKTNNIMLDSTFNAKLGDFGLARLVDHEKGSRTTLLAGTMGYMAPECHRTGKATKESDVFSFGVVALEIACGRRSIEPRYDEDQASLMAWVWQAYGNQRLLDVVDKKLSKNFDLREMECLLVVGLWCVHPIHSMRPSIKQAMQVLSFEAALPNLPSEMPIPRFEIPNMPIIEPSEPCLSNMSVTLPR